jgi:hypothetical protein
MSLDPAKLEKARELAGGIVQARCPACAEGGHDRTGQHLRIYPDGRFGCCVHPKDKEHRKRIFALAGRKGGKLPFHSSGTFSVRVKGPAALPASRSVKAALVGFTGGTLGTGKTKSEEGGSTGQVATTADFGTLGTPIFNPRAYELVEASNIDTPVYMCKGSESTVPSVPECLLADTGEKLPYLTEGGTLVIPFDSPARYHWWKGGQSIAGTRAEVTA